MPDVVVDASVWVSRLVPGDINHQRSRAWFDEQSSSGSLIVAPVLLLAEVAGAISRRTGEPDLAGRAVELIQQLATLRLVSIDPPLGRLASRLAADHALRGADAAYVAMAQRLGLPLITLDLEQLPRPPAVASVGEP